MSISTNSIRSLKAEDTQRFADPELDGEGGTVGDENILGMGQHHIQSCDDGRMGDLAGTLTHGKPPDMKKWAQNAPIQIKNERNAPIVKS